MGIMKLTRESASRKRRAGIQARSSGSRQPQNSAGTGSVLKLKGSQSFRYRLVSATLSAKEIVISEIRSLAESPGIRDFEASFLQLLDKVSSGSSISINETGTKLRYKPGTVVGGYELKHDCPTSRGIGQIETNSNETNMKFNCIIWH